MIRNLLYSAFLFSLLASCRTNGDQNQQKHTETVLFTADSTSSITCYRIPAIITASNGDLIAAIDERVPSCSDLKKNDDINIITRRSIDNGLNWTPVERTIDYPKGQSASDPSMIVDPKTGTIFLFFNYMDLINEKGVYYFKLIKSTDHGLTWSLPIDITDQITPDKWHDDFKFITSGRGIATKDGKLLHTIVNLDKGLFVFESDDHGASWHLLDTAIKPADESKIIELPNGSWMINSRVNGLGHRYIHLSTDQGQTWTSSPEHNLIDPGCNASILKYTFPNQQAMILFSNAKSRDKRKNMTITKSLDNGNTWSNSKNIYVGSAGYSSMTIISNGDIGLFYERNSYQEIVFTPIPLESLLTQKE